MATGPTALSALWLRHKSHLMWSLVKPWSTSVGRPTNGNMPWAFWSRCRSWKDRGEGHTRRTCCIFLYMLGWYTHTHIYIYVIRYMYIYNMICIYIYICSHILYIYKSTCFYILLSRSRERSSLAHRGGTKGRRDEGTKGTKGRSRGGFTPPKLEGSEVLLGKPSISLGRFMGNRCFPSKMGVLMGCPRFFWDFSGNLWTLILGFQQHLYFCGWLASWISASYKPLGFDDFYPEKWWFHGSYPAW